MRNTRSFQFVLLFSLVIASQSAVAQVVIATVPIGSSPHGLPVGIAVNSVTNKTYVANNSCVSLPNCQSAGTVTVIDGATNQTTTVNVGVAPTAVAVNPVTNKIYVANDCGNDLTCSSPGTVTVIDANNNNSTTTVNVGFYPSRLVVNPVTNKIYVVNTCGSDINCGSPGTVTVIDANNHNSTTTVNVGFLPYFKDVFLAVNSVSNQIYVPNCGTDVNCQSAGAVTVIDGATNNTTTVNMPAGVPYDVAINAITNKIYVSNNSPGMVAVIDGVTNHIIQVVNVGLAARGLAVDSVTNEIYVVNDCGSDPFCQSPGTVTVINGATYSTSLVAVGDGPESIAVNETTDRIYVPNNADNTVSVIAGDTGLQFVPVTPCRVVDTRNPPGTFGGPPIQRHTYRSFPIPQQGSCNIPASAAAYSLNVTLVPIQHGPVGYLTIWPAGEILRPAVSTMNSLDGRIKANAAVVPAGVSGGVSVYVTNTTNVVLDIDGYFAPTSGSTLAFYPLTPCRVLDTRNSDGSLGGPYLQGGQERDFPVLESSCNIPTSAQAYSMSFTVVPVQGQALGYLTVWPAGESQPLVSTLNNLTGTVVANAAIVPAGSGGEIATYPSQNTQLVGDINGYFAPAGQGGLSLYPAVPCRVLDTRSGTGAFSGELTVNVVNSVCAPPSTAQAYVFNATVVPPGALGYLTLWPDGEQQPVVSTLNAIDGAITSNMAVVGTNNGKIDAYASGITQLLLDISSYFAP